VVEALVHDGSFHLDFLQEGEHVAASSTSPGAFVVVRDGKVLVTVLPEMVLIREAEDVLVAVDRETFDSSYEEVGDQ
jgi:hypothetical protein